MFCSTLDEGGVPESLPFGRPMVGNVLIDKSEGMAFPPEPKLDECGSNPGPGVPFGNIIGVGPLGRFPPLGSKTGEDPTGPAVPFILVITADGPADPMAGMTGDGPEGPFGAITDGPLIIIEDCGNTGC